MPGSSCVLAARVNLTRDLASGRGRAHAAGVAYLEELRRHRVRAGRAHRRRPALRRAARLRRAAPAPVTTGERRRRIDAVVAGLVTAGRRAAERGVCSVRAAQPVRDRIANTAGTRSRSSSRVGPPGRGRDARHLPHEHGGVRHAAARSAGRASASCISRPTRTIAASSGPAISTGRRRPGASRHRL